MSWQAIDRYTLFKLLAASSLGFIGAVFLMIVLPSPVFANFINFKQLPLFQNAGIFMAVWLFLTATIGFGVED